MLQTASVFEKKKEKAENRTNRSGLKKDTNKRLSKEKNMENSGEIYITGILNMWFHYTGSIKRRHCVWVRKKNCEESVVCRSLGARMKNKITLWPCSLEHTSFDLQT